VNGLQLIGPQETQVVGLDVTGTLRFIPPRGFGLVVRALGKNDVVLADLLLDEASRIRHDLLVADYRVRGREGGDDVRVAAFEIPEIVQVAVGEDHEAAVLGTGVLAGLFLADERVLVFGLCLKDDEGKSLRIEQEEVDETLAGLLKVVAQRVQID